MPPDRGAGDGVDAFSFLSGGGELAALIRRFNWGETSIGAIPGWSHCLKTAVSLMLRSNVPMVMLWGEDGVMIYNDGYSVFAGGRHPSLLGSKVFEGWPEVAEFNAHVMQVCLAGGTLAYRDLELTLQRSGRPDQAWMNLDYSPVIDERGKPAGVIAIVVETTEKVAAERWQASERDRQRQMFEQAPGFMAMLSGPDHVFELTNAAYMQLIGHRNVIGKSVREALPDIAGQGFYELLDQVFSSGKAFTGSALKAELQRSPGAPKEERFIDLVYQPVRNPQGVIVGIFVQGVDVTDRLLVEQALRRSEEEFRTFAELMPNHVWTSAPNGALEWFNPRVNDYSGSTNAELEGNGWTGMVHPDDVVAAGEKWTEALASEQPYETEFRLRRHDGVYRWHIARAVPLRDEGGVVTRWVGTNTDIDDQKKATQALHESERRLQLSQNAAGIAALELDIATGTVFGSEGFWQLWGLAPRESVHISVLENIVIADDMEVRSNRLTREQGTAAPNVEYRIRRPDTGQLRWLSRNIDFVHDESGKAIKMFGVIQDITERREAEAHQQMLTHELEHRIKNILAMIAAIASQTLKNTDLDTARETFSIRLKALANAHDILNKTRWTSASMLQVVQNTMAALPAERISIDGAPIPISPKMALSLALAVNELGTNALKYGALSTDSGSVSVAWRLSRPADGGQPQLIWRWREQGGPAVVAPDRKGFGSFLIQRVFGADFGGTVVLNHHTDGVECILTAPSPEAAEAGLIAAA